MEKSTINQHRILYYGMLFPGIAPDRLNIKHPGTPPSSNHQNTPISRDPIPIAQLKIQENGYLEESPDIQI